VLARAGAVDALGGDASRFARGLARKIKGACPG
jgi:hypothetical protein